MVAVVLPAVASGSVDPGAITYTGTAVHISGAGVVDFSQLARLEAQRGGLKAPPAPMPEPQEKATPNVHVTVPSPFLAQLELPAAGTHRTFRRRRPRPASSQGPTQIYIPPDTNGAVGPTKVMATLNNNYVIRRAGRRPAFYGLDGDFLGIDRGERPVRSEDALRPVQQPLARLRVRSAAGVNSSILIGVSDTGDPSGTWHLYRFDVDSGNMTWADFPTIGFTKAWSRSA